MEALAFVIGVVLMVVGLAVSIALHELGHLWPAKKFGVRVGQYMIGFGPTLWSRRIGETEYGLKAIPLGGYISMAGMYPPSPKQVSAAASGHRSGKAGGGFFATMVQDARAANDETLLSEDDDRVFYRLPVWKRVVIMLGGPVMNLLFAIVLFAILLSGIGIQTATTTVSSVSDCVIPSESARTECEPTDPQAPAAAAGIRSGDVIVAVDDEPISTFAEAAALIQASPERAISITVERDGETLTLPLTPVAVEQPVLDARGQPVVGEDGEPQTERVGLAGIRQEVDYLREPVWVAPQMAFERVGAVAGIIWQMPVKVWEAGTTLVTGEERDPNGPLSIVGAGRLSGEVAAADAPVLNRVAGFLELLAAVNIALFVFNLIPLLPLDGGHVAVALWEGIKRVWAKVFHRPPPKPVDATKLVPVTFIVVVALIAMGAVLILTDIVNPVSLFG
ncbi:site-2 protease family protein [Microbacterium sp. CFH 31415]|uniref:M50 family metallopeptidase n=1 Tax=Microbacterium sp. CFH 31415 TaxID=2921732 RepID=UPI001F13D418|nr:site-2 protease family protein [Microbacterium sp. CFH 31415]MCH6232287.1 site-2 protease family protein [Microbacterium sp. CFH 31415]